MSAGHVGRQSGGGAARGALRAGRRGRALGRAAREAAQRMQAQRQLLPLPRGERAARAGRRPARQGACARRAAPLAPSGPGLRSGSGRLLACSRRCSARPEAGRDARHPAASAMRLRPGWAHAGCRAGPGGG